MIAPPLEQVTGQTVGRGTLARQRAQAAGGGYWLPVAAAACFAYGLVLIALIHTTADGSWFWYATALRQGQHLYRDLHLPLQPLFPLELALMQRVFGMSWIAQQAVGLFHLCLFLLALASVVVRVRGSGWQRALLFTCGFVTCLTFIMMRLDDFHVLATSLQLFCAALLLRFGEEQRPALQAWTLAALGLLCGCCLLTRVNDGALLLGAVVCIVLVGMPGRAHTKLLAALAVLAVAVGVVLAVVLAIGETPRVWWSESIRAAAAIKGGSDNLLLYPLRLPVGTLRELTRGWRNLALTLYALLAGAAAWVLADSRRKLSTRARWTMVVTVALLGLPLLRNIIRGNAARVLVAFTVFAIYACTAWVLLRLIAALRGKPAKGWSFAELLVLLPFAQLVSISLSAARWYPNTNPPAALLLVLLPVALPWFLRRQQVRAVFFTWLALLTLSAGTDKLRNPFDWFNYRAHGLAAPRVSLQHPAYGTMLIETSQLHLVQPVCAAVSRQPEPRQELLSLPFSYPNYFCNVRPWHGYVQTFYDTSSRQTIEALQRELVSAPPEWIVYQRQLDVLSRNEEAFNAGRPLPHRSLDTLIMSRLALHEWTAEALPTPPGDTSTWLLIHTRP